MSCHRQRSEAWAIKATTVASFAYRCNQRAPTAVSGDMPRILAWITHKVPADNPVLAVSGSVLYRGIKRLFISVICSAVQISVDKLPRSFVLLILFASIDSDEG